MRNRYNKFEIDYKTIFGNDRRVMLGHHKVPDYNDDDEEIEITVPRFEVFRCYGYDLWKLKQNEHYGESGDNDDVWFPEAWRYLKGEELCRVINDGYELYKASGKDKYLLEQFKPVIDDAVESEDYNAIFKSKESAVIAGKIILFMANCFDDENEPVWL